MSARAGLSYCILLRISEQLTYQFRALPYRDAYQAALPALTWPRTLMMDELFTFVSSKKTPAFIVTPVDRVTRCIVACEMCWHRTPETLLTVIDRAPPAPQYFPDAFNTYKDLCWWGWHTLMYNKSETIRSRGQPPIYGTTWRGSAGAHAAFHALPKTCVGPSTCSCASTTRGKSESASPLATPPRSQLVFRHSLRNKTLTIQHT